MTIQESPMEVDDGELPRRPLIIKLRPQPDNLNSVTPESLAEMISSLGSTEDMACANREMSSDERWRIVSHLSRFHPSLDVARLWSAALSEDQCKALIEVLLEPEKWQTHVQIFPSSVLALLDSDGSGLPKVDTPKEERQGRAADQLKTRNRFPGRAGWRRVALVDAAMDARLAVLANDFPNFVEVVDFLRDRVALASARNGFLQIDNVLLSGPPGIGKTEFVHQLATVLGVGNPVFIDMASAESSCAISGSEEHWSNAKPGRIFEAVVEGECASPLVVLDELDKAGKGYYVDPLGGLYRLLERSSATNFFDAFFPRLKFDASRVLWFATANDLGFLPKPLLSRFTIFHVEPPDQAQARDIARRIYLDLVADIRKPPVPDAVVFERLANQSVREFKRSLENALARAIRSGSSRLELCHLQATWAQERGMGFL